MLMDKPERVENLAWRRIGGRAVILQDSESREVHELDPVGTLIWESCDGVVTVSEICDRIVAEYDVAPDEALGDVRTFIQSLSEKRLIQ